MKRRSGKRQVVDGERRGKSPILSFGYAQPELWKKHELLSEMGFAVTSQSSFKVVKTLITEKGQHFKILLIGSMVPENERQALSDLYRRCCPDGKVISFYKGSINNAERATVLLSEQRCPENLLDTIDLLDGSNQHG